MVEEEIWSIFGKVVGQIVGVKWHGGANKEGALTHGHTHGRVTVLALPLNVCVHRI